MSLHMHQRIIIPPAVLQKTDLILGEQIRVAAVVIDVLRRNTSYKSYPHVVYWEVNLNKVGYRKRSKYIQNMGSYFVPGFNLAMT